MGQVATVPDTRPHPVDDASDLELMISAIRRLEASRNEDTLLLIQAREREIAMRDEIKALKTQLAAEQAKTWWQKLKRG